MRAGVDWLDLEADRNGAPDGPLHRLAASATALGVRILGSHHVRLEIAFDL